MILLFWNKINRLANTIVTLMNPKLHQLAHAVHSKDLLLKSNVFFCSISNLVKSSKCRDSHLSFHDDRGVSYELRKQLNLLHTHAHTQHTHTYTNRLPDKQALISTCYALHLFSINPYSKWLKVSVSVSIHEMDVVSSCLQTSKMSQVNLNCSGKTANRFEFELKAYK